MQNNRATILVRAKQPAQEFAIALISVMVATFVRLLLIPVLGMRSPFFTFFLAVVVSAWLGGWRGGMSAIVLSALSAIYFLIAPRYSLLINRPEDLLSLSIFVIVGVCVSGMGNLQRDRELKLAQSESRYRLLLETANEGALRTNTEDCITFINARMAQMLGYNADELLGCSIDELFFPEDVKRGQENRASRQEGTVEQFELRLRHRNQSPVWTLVSVTVIYESGEFTETFGLFTDITERKRAEERLDAAYQRETHINRIGQAIRDTTDPAAIQNAAVRALGEALNVDRAYYNAFDLVHDLSWIEDDYHRFDLPSLADEYKISSFEIQPAAYYSNGKTLILADTHAAGGTAPLYEVLRSLRIRALISVPLFDDGILVGTLAVAMADAPREWTAEEIALVETIAVQTRSALDLGRVHQREHRIAAELQNALLPTKPERVPRLELAPYMKPALDEAEIGGDFYDVFALDERYYALIVGDVSGKGLAAAAQLALIRNSLRTTLYLYHTPVAAVTQLNNILIEHELLVGFVTAFVSVYDSATGQITYASCGHEPGLVRRATTGDVEELETTSPPLGATETAIFMESVMTLTEGDILFLYTDGLSEAGPDRRNLLGTEGLKSLFAAQGDSPNLDMMATKIIDTASAYATGTFRDDVCLLIARHIK